MFVNDVFTYFLGQMPNPKHKGAVVCRRQASSITLYKNSYTLIIEHLDYEKVDGSNKNVWSIKSLVYHIKLATVAWFSRPLCSVSKASVYKLKFDHQKALQLLWKINDSSLKNKFPKLVFAALLKDYLSQSRWVHIRFSDTTV